MADEECHGRFTGMAKRTVKRLKKKGSIPRERMERIVREVLESKEKKKKSN